MKPAGKIKIIQSGIMGSGSTLLINLIHGFICPKEEIHWETENLIHEFLITKTHNYNINNLEKKFSQYNNFFIISERNDSKVQSELNNEYNTKKNVLIINYNKLLENNNNSINDIVNYTFDKFNNFIPKELKPNKDDAAIKRDMTKRVKRVNETVEFMKNKPFSEMDNFTHIHGAHRNRNSHINQK
jgi:uncharacterized protein (UPF0297 family)